MPSASKKISLTGDRPTGHLHLGHYIGSLVSRLALQETHDQIILIADFQAITHNAERIEEINEHIIDIMHDYLAVGLDPAKNVFVLQSAVPALHEIAAYYANLVPMSRLARNPTIKEELKSKSIKVQNSTASFLYHPLSQAADITAFQADVVPVGDDQKPLIEQCNEIVQTFSRLYKSKAIKKVEVVYTHCSRLPGINGKEKASKSLQNAIFLNDSPEEVRKKIFSMYTDPNHIHIDDPGKVEDNVVFSYLSAFYPDKAELEAIKDHYRRGGLGDVVIKKKLYDTIEGILEPIRARRKLYSRQDILEFLRRGTERANQIANLTLATMKKDMKLVSLGECGKTEGRFLTAKAC